MSLFRNPLKRHIDTVTLGGRLVALKPMGVEAALQFSLILFPHIAKIEAYWPRFIAVMSDKSDRRPALLKSLFLALVDEMRDSPGDITKGLSYLFGLEERYIAEKVTPAEIVEALPVADRLNGFQALYEGAKYLRLIDTKAGG